MTDSGFIHRNYLGGEWVAGPDQVADLNPSDTNDVVGHYTHADAAQARAAVAAAHAAFASGQYSPIQQRFEVLDQIGAELLARRDELGQLLSREEGKTRAEGIAEVA
ncbi:MAG: aldehyde dehydrogenase family protein, partial [Gammaproteobacteria bacterium]|nr:aldehyde dehydrogenase family protein [Gammaproteobacteria bacterium]